MNAITFALSKASAPLSPEGGVFACGVSRAQAWFRGLNPQLDDRSPARLLREGDLHEVGPEVLSAGRAFVSGG